VFVQAPQCAAKRANRIIWPIGVELLFAMLEQHASGGYFAFPP
jgi:hypothetical protein